MATATTTHPTPPRRLADAEPMARSLLPLVVESARASDPPAERRQEWLKETGRTPSGGRTHPTGSARPVAGRPFPHAPCARTPLAVVEEEWSAGWWQKRIHHHSGPVCLSQLRRWWRRRRWWRESLVRESRPPASWNQGEGVGFCRPPFLPEERKFPGGGEVETCAVVVGWRHVAELQSPQTKALP